ncbi:MAG: histidine phosphatase family protein [Bacteroidota bacterium]|nr:histidine phosphatase family protein [Bacteroidota bacterium]
MKQLIFVRHAKSDWGDEGLKDIDRPLSPRGNADAYTMSEWYSKKHDVPNTIISSDATRALSTAMVFARTMNFPTNDITVLQHLYESTAKTLKDVVIQIDNNHQSAMIFCHNPSVTNLVNELTDDLFFDEIPTCAIVAVEFDVNTWKELTNKKGKILFNQFPKEFK